MSLRDSNRMIAQAIREEPDGIHAKELRIAPIALRVYPSLKAALETAAKRDRRTLSAMAEIILTEWLTQKGYLGDTSELKEFSKEEVDELVRAYRSPDSKD